MSLSPREAPLPGKVPIPLESSKDECAPTDRVDNATIAEYSSVFTRPVPRSQSVRLHEVAAGQADLVLLPAGTSRTSRPPLGPLPRSPRAPRTGGLPRARQPAGSAMEMGGRSPVELENLVIGSAHDEQCRAAYGGSRAAARSGRPPRDTTARTVFPGDPAAQMRCGCAGAGAEVSAWQRGRPLPACGSNRWPPAVGCPEARRRRRSGGLTLRPG